jgi:hypothetical protein
MQPIVQWAKSVLKNFIVFSIASPFSFFLHGHQLEDVVAENWHLLANLKVM